LAGEVIPGRPVVVGNPIVTDTYTSDPAVLVHEGTAYLYTGHDEAPAGVDEYVMRDWLCFSSTDLRTWRSHGPLLAVDRFTWARGGAKAGAVVERDGRFFWYVAVDHATVPGGAIGVAVADTPLDATMTVLAGSITEIALPDFKEGAHVHERDGWFYLSYGYRYPQRVAYARSRGLDGPWIFEGILNEVPGNCATNRPGIVEFAGEWFFFYHNGVLPGGGSHRRSVCVDRLTYDADGRMDRVRMTTEGLRTATLPV
jgi:hypothetical protein